MGTRWYAAETGSGMTLADTARLKCGDMAVDGETMTRETTDVLERAGNLRTRRGWEGRGRDPSSDRSDTLRHDEIGTGDQNANARDQPRLPFCSGSRDLFPLGRNPQHVLPSQGYFRRVETLRGRRCVVCLELALWKTRDVLLCTHSDAGRLCGAGGQPSLCDAG